MATIRFVLQSNFFLPQWRQLCKINIPSRISLVMFWKRKTIFLHKESSNVVFIQKKTEWITVCQIWLIVVKRQFAIFLVNFFSTIQFCTSPKIPHFYLDARSRYADENNRLLLDLIQSFKMCAILCEMF